MMDYEALAKQFGGVKASAVDYDALAKELGGTTAPVAAAELPGHRRTWSDVASEIPTSIGPSAKRFVGGLVEAVTSPVKTVTALGDVLAGGLRAAVPRQVAAFIDQIDNPETTKRIEAAAQAAGGAIKERYGGIEQLKNTIATDPVGAAADISLLLSGGGAVIRGAGTAAKAAGVWCVAANCSLLRNFCGLLN